MKVTLGMRVHGECGTGEVIAMTEQWCIYRERMQKGHVFEYAEPWEQISIVAERGDPASALTEKVTP